MEFLDMSNAQIVNLGGQLIETRVAESAKEVDDWINSIYRYRGQYELIVVGLDCEWRPNVRPGMNNRTAILQLCVGNKCLIIQLFHMDYIPQSLNDFMRDPKNLFVGVEVDRDVAKLYADYGLECDCTADVRQFAIKRWPFMFSNKQLGLKDIAYNVVGLHMLKPSEVRRSDWQARVLTAAQVEYATIDAYASYCIGYRLFLEN